MNNLNDFNLMNNSLFTLKITGDHYSVDDTLQGVSSLMERLLFLEDPPKEDRLFEVFCTKNAPIFEKLYLNDKGDITLSVVVKILK